MNPIGQIPGGIFLCVFFLGKVNFLLQIDWALRRWGGYATINRKYKGGTALRKWICALMALIFMMAWLPAVADDSFIVVEEEEVAAPDPRRQARALMRNMTLEEMIYQLSYLV